MSIMYAADTVGNDGKVYPTIGENIRNSSSAEGIASSISTNNDKATITSALDIDAELLKEAIIMLFTGEGPYFGGADTTAFTEEEKN